MWCHSCREEYEEEDAGTCKECYEEASETEEELKREIEDLKTKVAFLRLCSPVDPSPFAPVTTDIVLHAASGTGECVAVPPIPAHRAVLGDSDIYKADDPPLCNLCH